MLAVDCISSQDTGPALFRKLLFVKHSLVFQKFLFHGLYYCQRFIADIERDCFSCKFRVANGDLSTGTGE